MRAAFPLLLSVAGCAAGSSIPEAVRTDSAGIEIVETPGDDFPLGWKVTPVTTMSSDEDGPAGPYDPNDALIHADRVGNIYALDYRASRVLVFGADGRFVRALGRKGAGPGEMGFPISFTVSDEGVVGVFDISKHKLVRFGADGSALEELTLGPGFTGGQIHTTPNGFLHDYQAAGGSAGRRSGLYLQGATTGSVLMESADPPVKAIELASCRMGFSGMPPLFAPSYRWDARGGTVAVTRDAGYDIRVYDGAREIRRIRRDVEPRASTPELAEQEVGDGMRVRTEGGERVCAPDDVVKQRGFAPHIPIIGRIAIAPDGELWVRRGGVKGEKLPIDVFAPDGAYRGTLDAETPFPAAFLPNGQIVAVTKDEMDVGQIVIYRIEK